MVAPKRYIAAGICIYCGDTDQTVRTLGEEHIIPRGLGGSLVIPRASCQKCEEATSQIETACLLRLAPLRAQVGVKGRRSRKVRRSLPFIKTHTERPISIALDSHPSVIVMPTWGIPGLLSGVTPGAVNTFSNTIIPVTDNFNQKLLNLGGQFALGGVNDRDMALMLAKIGHAYAFAELGLSKFEPYLGPLIRGLPSFPYRHFVGETIPIQPKSDQLHELHLMTSATPRGETVYFARIRLFAMREFMPTYDVVVGGMKSQ